MLVTTLMLLSTIIMPIEVFARTRTIKTIEPSGTLNLTINSSGVLEWNTVLGATGYTVKLTQPNVTQLNEWNSNHAGFAIVSIMDQLKYSSNQYTICVDANGISSHGCISYYYTSNVDQIEAPTNLRWNGYTAEWDAVDGAGLYYVALYDFNGRVTYQSTTNTTFDFLGFSPKAGWTFKVQTVPTNPGTLSSLRNSEYIESPSYEEITTVHVGADTYNATTDEFNSGGKVKNGANIDVWQNKNANNQKFKFTKIN